MMGMRIGSETGSLVNMVLSNDRPVEPAVGMGVTILRWSDRHAATIVKVTRTQIHVQRDKATRVDTNGVSDMQTYTYERDGDAPVLIFRKTKKGWRMTGGGSGLLIGERCEHYDYSF